MKYLLLILPLISLSMAQRPSYAGSRPIGRPELASRFRDENETPAPVNVGLSNRVGENGQTEKIPVDARGDYALVDRLNQWPREHRPFWLLNAEAIEQQRNTAPQQTLQSRAGGAETIPARPEVPRSSFLSSRN